jgi:hypothetical protein
MARPVCIPTPSAPRHSGRSLGGDAAMKQTLSILALALLLTGCGGTYVDDKRNFERSFGSKCPAGLRVMHSIFIQTPHFTEEHMYYFDLTPVSNSVMPQWLTNAPGIVQTTNGLEGIPWPFAPRKDHPKWFAPESSTNYDIWYHTNTSYVVLRNKRAGEIFVYGSVGM